MMSALQRATILPVERHPRVQDTYPKLLTTLLMRIHVVRSILFEYVQRGCADLRLEGSFLK